MEGNVNFLEKIPQAIQDIIDNKYEIVFLSEESNKKDIVTKKEYELKTKDESVSVGNITINFFSKKEKLIPKDENDFSTRLAEREMTTESTIRINFKTGEKFILDEKGSSKVLRLVSEAILKQTDPDYFKSNEIKE